MPEAHSFLTFWAYPAHSCVSSFCLRERLEKGSQRDKEGTWGGNVHYSCCENQWWAEWRGRRLRRASASAPKPVPNTNKWSPWINISILWALFILTRVTLASSRALRGRRNNPCTFYKVSAEVRTGPCSQGLSDCVTSSQVCVCVCVCVCDPVFSYWGNWEWKSLSCVRLFATPWTIQSMDFSRPECWSG